MNTLEEVIKQSKSYREALRNLNRAVTGRSVHYLRKKIESFGINTSHFVIQSKTNKDFKKLKWEEILVKERKGYRESGKRLTQALIESGVEYKCNKCYLIEWINTRITLEVNHIDGNSLNNEKSNLEFLCPNCHSLTPNFYRKKTTQICKCGSVIEGRGKNCFECAQVLKGLKLRKVERPNKELLEKLVWEIPTTEIAIKYKVSDVAVSKWCKSYKIEKPKRGYWSKQ